MQVIFSAAGKTVDAPGSADIMPPTFDGPGRAPAGVAKLVDAADSKSAGLILRVGSSPTSGTIP